MATRYALDRARHDDLPVLQIQHHHAHVAACMVDNGLQGEQPVIGISFDGTGYGDDGAIWGGEFRIADYQSYQRVFHLDYVTLPGGDKAVHEPWRMALAWLQHCGLPWSDELAPVRFIVEHNSNSLQQLNTLQRQIETGLNSPLTSSIGRLFDSVSALIGVRQLANYEAQAAIELEALVDPQETGSYNFSLNEQIGFETVFKGILDDIRAGVPTSVIAARFHNTLAWMVLNGCQEIRRLHKIDQVCLSGGVWQNTTLLTKTERMLYEDNFGRAFWLGLLAGLAANAGILYWIAYVTHVFGKLPLPLAIGVMLLLAGYLSLYRAVWAFGVVAAANRGVSPLWWAPTLWVALEYVQTYLFNGFPWELLGYGLYRYPLFIQVADLTGVYGVSFLIVLANTWIFLICSPRFRSVHHHRRQEAVAVLLIMAWAGYGAYRLDAMYKICCTKLLETGMTSIAREMWSSDPSVLFEEERVAFCQVVVSREFDQLISLKQTIDDQPEIRFCKYDPSEELALVWMKRPF